MTDNSWWPLVTIFISHSKILHMRFLILLMTIGLLSCGQNESKETQTVHKDTAIVAAVQKDTLVKSVKPRPPFYRTPDEAAVNGSISKKFGDKWHVLNDHEAKWIKDAFDYFIVPKRKEYPDYPYISTGDFNGDGK